LTREEIEGLRVSGLILQNSASLNSRIDTLLQDNIVSHEIAELLKSRNQSNDSNRVNKLWFCFFEPYLAGECGIGRFFRSWGGEALYSLHEDNPITGEVLRSIGIPCIVKANIPIASMNESKYPTGAMARVLLQQDGHRIRIPIEHEGYSVQNILPSHIVEIFEYPSQIFHELTKCNEWRRYAI
jgi:hypothetical protein